MSKEFEIIETIFTRSRRPAASVVLGIGDDAALTRCPEGCDLVTATDALVAGTHFLAEAPAESVGHRSLAVNLSDIAAMAAEPLWASLAISLPGADSAWLKAFAEGFFSLADHFGIDLIGGDTVRGALSAVVTLQGCVPRGNAIRRSGARPGDHIFVTGFPGEAEAGRRLATGELATDAGSVEAVSALVQKFQYPQPRVMEALALRGIASAMIDLSDGLHVDLERLLVASNAGARLDVDQVPASPHLGGLHDLPQFTEQVLVGGEDYELCFTVPADSLGAFHRAADLWGCPATCLGQVSSEAGLQWFRDGDSYAVPDSGFEHFA
jgi:thiamine-monophosphate kinase